MVQPGQTLRMERGGAVLMVEGRLGEGSQGVVHRPPRRRAVRGQVVPRPGRRRDAQVDHRAGRARTAAAPGLRVADRPRQLRSSARVRLRDADARAALLSLAQLLNRPAAAVRCGPSRIGRNLVDAFAALHSAGLCYRDISFGNLWVDPATRDVAIIDNDNVGIDGADFLVKGTGRFMAPEILRDEALPSTVTDLHSLAVLLFYLFMHGHPLLGARRPVLHLGRRRARVGRRGDAAQHRPPAPVHLRPR